MTPVELDALLGSSAGIVVALSTGHRVVFTRDELAGPEAFAQAMWRQTGCLTRYADSEHASVMRGLIAIADMCELLPAA